MQASVRDTVLVPKATFGEMVTAIWRLRQLLVDLPPDQPYRSTSGMLAIVENVHDELTQAGYRLQDHTGDPYVPGMVLHVLAFQPEARLDRDTIIETLRPSVYRGDVLIQMGEVIVGTPQPAARPAPGVAPAE